MKSPLNNKPGHNASTLQKRLSGAAPLYLLTDTRSAGLTHVRIAEKALRSGVTLLQMREKHSTKKDIYLEALRLKAVTSKHGALLIINDYIDIALAVDADGVHLGQDDMPVREARKIMGTEKIIGISTHTLLQAQRAEEGGADYIGFGPIFRTGTKDAGKPRGLKQLQNVREHINIPIAAIGGITSDNIRDVLMSGADAAAVASGILCGDITENIKKYTAALEKERNG